MPAPTAEVLVLEDEPMIGELISRALESAGFGVLGPFAAEQDALHLLEGVVPDLAVLDVGLRGGTCFKVADRLADASVPIIFMSGYAEAELPERFAAHAYFSKPFDPRKLAELISQLLGR